MGSASCRMGIPARLVGRKCPTYDRLVRLSQVLVDDPIQLVWMVKMMES